MLLVAILAILSGQGSLLGMERFAKRHRKTLNQLLGTHIAKCPRPWELTDGHISSKTVMRPLLVRLP